MIYATCFVPNLDLDLHINAGKNLFAGLSLPVFKTFKDAKKSLELENTGFKVYGVIADWKDTEPLEYPFDTQPHYMENGARKLTKVSDMVQVPQN